MEKANTLKEPRKIAHKTTKTTKIKILLAVILTCTIIASIPGTLTVNLASAEQQQTIPQRTEWTINFGGSGYDYARCVVQTSDGGYVAAGYTNSFGLEGYDFWITKADYAGNILWNKTYGGTNYDYAYCVVQTSDGGYAIVGSTNSFGAGASDIWLVKIDSLGNKLWDKTYGGTHNDYASCVVQTSDGGYAIIGSTNSFGAGASDVWLIRTDLEGNAISNKTYGGTQYDYASSIVQTSDGGYAIAGYISSYSYGRSDALLVKTDSLGNIIWDKTYDETYNNYAFCVVQTSDSGYALAGQTITNDICGTSDFWLVKTDSSGNKLWDKNYDGKLSDCAYCIVQTSEGGYAMVGISNSLVPAGSHVWMVKTDSDGNKLWDKTFGEYYTDAAFCIVQTSDSGYAIAGYITSSNSETTNAWLVKVPPSNISLTGITIVSGGTSYTTPHVILAGGGGTGATAIARVSQGVIIGLVLTNPGYGYTSIPSTIIRDPSPRAKGATATINYSVS